MTTSGTGSTGGVRGVDATIAVAWCGPDEHGIARFARHITAAATALGFGGAVRHEVRPDRFMDLVDRLPASTRLLHVQANDWLFADAGVDVDRAVADLADRLRRRDVALAVTLHDLPQLSDGHALYQRRCHTYRLWVASTVGVAISSEHERALLQEALGNTAVAVLTSELGQWAAGLPPVVIPLPIDRPVPSRPTDTRSTDAVDHSHRIRPGDPMSPTIGIFGYLYPGKGHREVIDELTGMDPAPAVVALGRTSDRHGELLDELIEFAGRRGIVFQCTGYVPDAELPSTLQGVSVALAPHTHVSASASINSWLAAGRRPLVPAGRYVHELEQRMPGALWIYRPGELRRNVELALAHPELTWLSKDVIVGPSTAMVAERYLEWLRLLAAEFVIG